MRGLRLFVCSEPRWCHDCDRFDGAARLRPRLFLLCRLSSKKRISGAKHSTWGSSSSAWYCLPLAGSHKKPPKCNYSWVSKSVRLRPGLLCIFAHSDKFVNFFDNSRIANAMQRFMIFHNIIADFVLIESSSTSAPGRFLIYRYHSIQ